MTTKEFEAFVERNATKPHMQYPGLVATALAGEVGELLGELKKEFDAQDGTHRQDEITSEMGDVLHYLTRLAMLRGMTLDELMELNVEKLKKRGAK